MFQIADGTSAEARRHYMQSHLVVEHGTRNALTTCWFNGLSIRVVPSTQWR